MRVGKCVQVEATKLWGEENKRWKLFVSHFYDCELCWGRGMTPGGLAACHASFREHYEFAHCRFQRCALLLVSTHGADIVHSSFDLSQPLLSTALVLVVLVVVFMSKRHAKR